MDAGPEKKMESTEKSRARKNAEARPLNARECAWSDHSDAHSSMACRMNAEALFNISIVESSVLAAPN